MRAALIYPLLLTGMMTGAAAFAQEAGDSAPPVVSSEAPAAPAAPAADQPAAPLAPASEAAPALPAAGNENAAPATGAPAATAPAAVEPAPAGPAPADPVTAEPAATSPAENLPAENAPAALSGVAPVTPAQAEPAPPAPLGAHSVRFDALFWDAHWIVQAVMVGLAVAAFAALVILIHKMVEFSLAFGAMRRTARVLTSARDLHEAALALKGRKGPAADIVRAADEELRFAEAEPDLIPGTRERTDAAASRIEAGAAQKLRAGTGLLASIGSLAPFVGLFGTVFGIMNSFIAIAESKTTNLAVVAPGIAEALLATAIGLAAAIPAVAIYNICTRRLATYRHQLNDIAAAAARLQSRALDRLAAAAARA